MPKRPKIKKCRYCGKQFIAKNARDNYCSQNCYDAFYVQEKPKENLKRHNKPSIELINCAECGKQILKKAPSHKFCSRTCYERARRKRTEELKKHGFTPQAIRHKKKPREYHTVTCLKCGKLFKSWDKARNRRCATCQSQIETEFAGYDTRLIEGVYFE